MDGGQVGDEQVREAIEHELASLDPACRADPARLGALLADDFHEFGASGGELVKEGTAELVAGAMSEPMTTERMRGRRLADGLVLVKYTSTSSARRANRTSIWRRVAPGRWQLIHHQGTPTQQP